MSKKELGQKVRPYPKPAFKTLSANISKNGDEERLAPSLVRKTSGGYDVWVRSVALLEREQELMITRRHFTATRELCMAVLECAVGRKLAEEQACHSGFVASDEAASHKELTVRNTRLLTCALRLAESIEQLRQTATARKRRKSSKICKQREELRTLMNQMRVFGMVIQDVLPTLDRLVGPRLARNPEAQGDALLSWYLRVKRIQEVVAKAKSRLVECNLRLVIYYARKHVGRGLSLDDLVQEGNIGLMRAVDTFDYRLGYRFVTYASWWIRQTISRGTASQGNTIRLPVHVVEKVRRISRSSQMLQQQSGRLPEIQEIAEAADVPAAQVSLLREKSRKTISLDTPLRPDSESSLLDLVPNTQGDSPLVTIIARDTSRQLHRVLAQLSPREEMIVRLRFGIGEYHEHTLEEIGQQYKLTRERIRQIEAKALNKLRRITRRKDLAAELKGV